MKNNLVDAIARSLVQHAARRAPAALAERLEEEWLADFAERRGPLARLRFGVGCVWATNVIAHEYLEPKVAVATAGGGTVASSHHPGPDFSFLSGRTLAVLGIIGLHGLMVYAFATGMVHKVVKAMEPSVAVFHDEPRKFDQPPPLPPPTDLQLPQPVTIPNPDVPPIDIEKVGTFVVPVVQAPPEGGTATVLPPPPVKRVLGGPAKGFPNTDDYYPAYEIRNGTTGTATVSVCTDEKGRLTADPTLVQGSGSTGLDQGALHLAKSGSGHYRATTEDGRAVSSCFPFRVTFSMKN